MSGVAFAGSVLVASVFAVAAILKLRRPTQFRDELEDYGLLPGRLVGPVATFVPLLEFGGAVATAHPGTYRAGALTLLALLAVFTAALVHNLIRGRTMIRCACFGGSSAHLTWALPLRNLVMSTPLVLVLVTEPALTLSGAATAVLAAALAWVLVETAGLMERVRGELHV